MKICMVHNRYGKYSGEEAIVDGICSVLNNHGHQVIRFSRSSEEIPKKWTGKINAFLSGIYNPFSRRSFRKLLQEQKPDIIHIQNLLPFISVSILPECHNAGIPVVMTVQNYRLVCPTGLHMVHGQLCEMCSGGKEYWCVLRNCEGSVFKSVGYAARNWVARKGGYYSKYVTMFSAVTEFQRKRLINAGFDPERIVVAPNMARIDEAADTLPSDKDFVAHIGRVSPEKGIPTLLDAARHCPDTPFKATGSLDRMPELATQAPLNFQFVGFLDPEQLTRLYIDARIIVISTLCFEGFPMTVVEAMLHGKPVVCSRIGGLPEIVEDGITGLLFEAGNAEELSQKIRFLWERPELCARMGKAGREKALKEYSLEKYYERLMLCYDKAMGQQST